jgi:MFS family permease
MLLVATFGTFFASTSIVLNLFLYLQDVGWSAKLAAAGLSTVFVVGLFGKTLVGLAAERWGVPAVWRMQQAILLLGAALLTAATPGLLFPALALVGLGWAGCYVLTQVVIADFFAGPNLSRMTGLFIVFEAISSGSGVWSAGAIFDLAGSYRPAFILDCALIVAALVAGWITTRPALRPAEQGPHLPPSRVGYSPPSP